MSSYEYCYNCGTDDGVDVDKRRCTECGAYWTLITKKAHGDVLDERFRQTSKEGWTPEHDDEHADGSLAIAAACYADPDRPMRSFTISVAENGGRDLIGHLPCRWPWEMGSWKPKDRRRDLVRAAALILAEIERLDRAALKAMGAK